jgi:hypothetical protein
MAAAVASTAWSETSPRVERGSISPIPSACRNLSPSSSRSISSCVVATRSGAANSGSASRSIRACFQTPNLPAILGGRALWSAFRTHVRRRARSEKCHKPEVTRVDILVPPHFSGYDRKKHDAGISHYIPVNLGEIPDYYRRFMDPVSMVVLKTCPMDGRPLSAGLTPMSPPAQSAFWTPAGHFRSTPESRQVRSRWALRKSDKSRLMHGSKQTCTGGKIAMLAGQCSVRRSSWNGGRAYFAPADCA